MPDRVPLKVLLFIDHLGSGGAQRQLVTLARGLARRGFAVTVAIYHPVYHFLSELEEVGVPLVTLGRGGWDLRVAWRFRALQRARNFDIIHCYLSSPGILARIAMLGDSSAKIITSQRSSDLSHSRLHVGAERLLHRRSKMMIVNADGNRIDVESVVPSWKGRIRLVYNGVEFIEPSSRDIDLGKSFRQANAPDGELLIGVVAAMRREKNPFLLIDALLELPEDVRSRLKVVWVGKVVDEGLMAAVESRLRDVNLERKIVFHPETREIVSVYQAIDGLLLPSLYEGFPNAILEAMAYGVPVLATDVGDNSKLVMPGSTGWLIPSGNAESLAQAFAEFANLPREGRLALGEQARTHVRSNFTVERLVDNTVAVYSEVLAS